MNNKNVISYPVQFCHVRHDYIPTDYDREKNNDVKLWSLIKLN